MDRRYLLIFRAVFLLAAALSAGLAALIVASVFLAEGPVLASRFTFVSALVGAIFLGLAALLHGVGRHVAALSSDIGTCGGERQQGLHRSLSRLARLLLIAGVALAILLGGINIGVIARIQDGSAVFG